MISADQTIIQFFLRGSADQFNRHCRKMIDAAFERSRIQRGGKNGSIAIAGLASRF